MGHIKNAPKKYKKIQKWPHCPPLPKTQIRPQIIHKSSQNNKNNPKNTKNFRFYFGPFSIFWGRF
jgi:hypothetical protein